MDPAVYHGLITRQRGRL